MGRWLTLITGGSLELLSALIVAVAWIPIKLPTIQTGDNEFWTIAHVGVKWPIVFILAVGLLLVLKSFRMIRV